MSESPPAAGDVRYYLDDYSDETVPCDCTLGGWAQWLSAPSETWNRPEAAADGATFRASVIAFGDDVLAVRTGDDWSYSYEPEGATLLALRHGPGLGWDADSIHDDWAALRDHFDDPDNAGDLGNTQRIAVGYDEPDVMLTYRAIKDGAPLEAPRLDVSSIS